MTNDKNHVYFFYDKKIFSFSKYYKISAVNKSPGENEIQWYMINFNHTWKAYL